jgi:hypothetical protein
LFIFYTEPKQLKCFVLSIRRVHTFY